MWRKLIHRNKIFYIQSTPNGRRAFAVFNRFGKLLCRFGQPGADIRPGTAKGNSYCTRSEKIKGPSLKGTAWERSPNYWSRLNWSCKGALSTQKANFFGKARKVKPPRF